MRSQKKKKRPLSISSDNSCFFTHNGIAAPKTTREGQESTTKTWLHLAMTSNVQEASAFYSESSKQVPLLGLLLRGCRPKLRSMSGRVEVIQPVARACTTFWLKGKGKGIIGSAEALPIIVREVLLVRERERGTEKEREIDGSDVTVVALKLAMNLHFPLPKIRTIGDEL